MAGAKRATVRQTKREDLCCEVYKKKDIFACKPIKID